MPAVQDTIDRVRKIDVDQYKYGFQTEIAMDKAPKGLSEDIIRFISAKKDEPSWMLEWRLEAYRRWLTLEEPTWARVHYPKIDFQDLYYYAAPKSTPGPTSLSDVDPELLEGLREARHSAQGTGNPRRRAEDRRVRSRGAQRQCLQIGPRRRRRGVRFRLRRHHLQEGAGAGRRHLLLDLGSHPRASGTGAEISRLGRADLRQFLRHAEFGRVHRRLVRLRAQGRALPDGAVDLFPHEREEHRPVRAHADHRRGGGLRLLSRRLHGAAARREPAACRGRRTGRARRCRDQIFDGAELVPRRRRGQGRHLQFRHQARRLPRRPFEDFVDAGRDRFGDHLEISELHPARRRFLAASSIRSPCRTAISRSTAAPR